MRLGLGLGVKNSGFVGGYDSATSAFLAATGITSKTESDAVNNLVIRLKSYGLWSKMKAIYPFVSDTYNMFSYTEDFTNGYYGKTALSVTANTTTAPNGTTTADTVTVTGTSDNLLRAGYGASSFDSNVYQTTSIYVKKGNARWFKIRNIYASDGIGNAWFDLDNGTLGTIGSGQTATITSVGNGWYRLTLTAYKPTGATNIVDFSVTANNGSNQGNVNDFTYIWGSQVEVSSTASTYQPIATTPANRFVSQFKYNLKDARDLDAAFRLAFNGTWTYSKQGATPNGVNAYADTYSRISADFTPGSVSFSYYSRSNTSAPTTYTTEIGVGNGTPNLGYYELDIRRTSGNAQTNMSDLFTNYINYTNPDSLGYYIANRNGASVLNLWKNNTKVGSNTTASTFNNLPTNNILIAAAKDGASAIGNYSNRQTAFATLGNGLTDTEATNLYTSVQLFQQELARYVGVPIVSDANAQAFLDAAVITDQTQANAVNTLVTDLKSYGLWTKMKAIYPFVGGTATTHKWNLKDPRDLDAAYRLAFSGAWTHSSTGALPNGANAYADSFLTPLSALTNNNTHLSYYSRTNTNGTFADIGVSGVGPAYTPLLAIYIRDTDNMATRMYGYDTGENFQSANTNSQGLFIGNRTSSTVLNQWKNSTKLGTATYTNGRNITTLNLKTFIGAMNLGGTASQYTNRESAFATIGDGLSDTESANLYTSVQKYQTSLNRQIP